MAASAVQEAYTSMLQSWNYSDRMFWTLGMVAVHNVVWWSLNLVLYFIYHFDLFAKHKIQDAKWPDRDLVIKCFMGSLVGTSLVVPSFFYVVYPLFTYFGMNVHAPIPGLFTFLWQIPVFFLMNDAVFYWVHRGLHHPSIYKHIHKKHHMFKQPIAIATEYSHPVEELFANTLPTFIAPLLLGSHPVVVWVYLVLRLWETIDAHSGYTFPWSIWAQFPYINGGPQFHDYHHSNNVGNYGMLRIWDTIMGTDVKYLEHLKKLEGLKAKDGLKQQ